MLTDILTPDEVQAALDRTQVSLILRTTPLRPGALLIQGAHGVKDSFVFTRSEDGKTVEGLRIHGATREEREAAYRALLVLEANAGGTLHTPCGREVSLSEATAWNKANR